LTGKYEELNEKSSAMPGIDLICFTDDNTLSSPTWKIEVIEPYMPNDLQRSQRHVKACPHQYDQLSSYDMVVYIDNNVTINKQIGSAINKFFESGNPLGLYQHTYRSSLYEEFLAVKYGNYDAEERIEMCFNDLLENFSFLLVSRPLWGGVIFRNMHDPKTHLFGASWFSAIVLGPRRDQLSLPLALHLNSILPYLIDQNIFCSDFHSWPEYTKRRPRREIHACPEDRLLVKDQAESLIIQEKLAIDKELVRLACLYNISLKESTSIRHAIKSRLKRIFS
jgi:hypothetical protein